MRAALAGRGANMIGLGISQCAPLSERTLGQLRAKRIVTAGADISYVANDLIYTFKTNGIFQTRVAVTLAMLIVAGGGAGGFYGGGGGGGGVIQVASQLVLPGRYIITVGDGGLNPYPVVQPFLRGTNGGNSSAFGLVAIGGGAGGSYGDAVSYHAVWNDGVAGGSGGGGSWLGSSPAGAGTSGQGYVGGAGYNTASTPSGGGGGAGGPGVAGTTGNAGAGGIGISSSISGTSTYYGGGGGGGGSVAQGAGGLGGGSNGTGGVAGIPATPNTGGGSGGSAGVPGRGGSGIVIVRFSFQ